MNTKLLIPAAVMAVAALLGYGAGYVAKRIAADDADKQLRIKVIMKSTAMVLAIAGLLLITYLK